MMSDALAHPVSAAPVFKARLAASAEDLRAVKRLRYEVFVRELGGDGPLVDHKAGLEQDKFDNFADHMLVWDQTNGRLAGAYRLLRDDQAAKAGGFYTEGEYDLAVLKTGAGSLLEMGRSCLHRDYRSSLAMFHLWNGLAAYVAQHQIDTLFGVASFPGIDPAAIADCLTLLHLCHLAPPHLRVRVHGPTAQTMNLTPLPDLNRRSAMVAMPSLIKAYLRLGGVVGEGAYVDHAFNTTDVCLILPTAEMNQTRPGFFSRGTTG